MYRKMSVLLTAKLIKTNIVKKEDLDVYAYGFELLISAAVSISIILIFASLIHNIIPSLLFLLGFITARLLCGGYHAKKHITCFLTTILNYALFVSATFLFNKYEIDKIATLVMVVLSTLLIFLLAPAEHENNPMTQEQLKHHQKCSRIFIIFFALLVCPLILNNIIIQSLLCLTIGVFSVSISLLISKLDSFNQHRKY